MRGEDVAPETAATVVGKDDGGNVNVARQNPRQMRNSVVTAAASIRSWLAMARVVTSVVTSPPLTTSGKPAPLPVLCRLLDWENVTTRRMTGSSRFHYKIFIKAGLPARRPAFWGKP